MLFFFLKYLNEKRAINEKFKKAENFYNMKMSKILFENWRDYIIDFRVKKEKANKNYEIKIYNKKLEYFNQWRDYTIQSKDENHKEIIANTFHLKNFLLKVN